MSVNEKIYKKGAPFNDDFKRVIVAYSEFVSQVIQGFVRLHEKTGDIVYNFYQAYSRIILDGIHVGFKSTFDVLLMITIGLTLFYLIMAVIVLGKKKRTGKALKAGNEPFVTIQIPTYNELAAISCAKRCVDFDYPKEKMQIIIGDDSNDKSVSARIDAFAKKHPGLVQVTRRGKNIGFKPGNLNHMLKFTKGEYIVIFDSDFLPERDFLRRILQPFTEDRNVAAVQARWRIQNFNQSMISVLGGSVSLTCHHIVLPFISSNKGTSFLCGSAEAIRKSDLLEIGGWQAGSLTEDIECSLRLMMARKRLVYLPDLECNCEAPFKFKDLCKQQMRWAYGVITAIIGHFPRLVTSKMRVRDKVNIGIFASGYLFSILLMGLTVFGFLAVISQRPAPIDWAKFLSETGRNVLLTSGFLIASLLALGFGKRLKEFPRMIAGSFSVGLVVTYYVNLGIAKAVFGRGMTWYMLNKNGNKRVEEK